MIFKSFKIIPFYEEDIVKKAHEVNKLLDNYIDSIIVATAITLNEELITEDTIINKLREVLYKKYGLRVKRYKDLVKDTL